MGTLTVQVGDQEVVIPVTLESPSTGADLIFSGADTLVSGFTVPEGQVWEFDPNVSTTLTVRANVIVHGTLRMRPASPDVVHRLQFENVNESAFVGNINNTVEPTDVGLWVEHGGVVDAVGAPKTAWTRATHALAIGAQVLTVEDASGWRVGDRVVITPTARPGSLSSWWDRYSVTTITGISSNTITTTPLNNAHPAITDQTGEIHRAEVLNLTRNVVIRGNPGQRAHVAYMHAHNPVHWSDVELAYLGPRKNGNGILGRYPLHLHLMGEGARGSLVKSVVIHDAGHRGFVTHTSHGVTHEDCVVHDTFDACYWWDQAPDTRTVGAATDDLWWKNCVASRVQFDPSFRAYRHSAFLLGRGQRNRMHGCVAVGVVANTDDVNNPAYADSAGITWPEEMEGEEGIWDFSGNLAHNCQGSGVFTWQNTGLHHLVGPTVVYHCSTGLNHGAYVNRYVYEGWTVFACREAIRMHALGWGSAMILRDWDIDLNGLGAQAIRFVKHTLNGTVIVFERFKLRGYTQRAVFDQGETNGTEAVFIDCDWQAGPPHIVLSPPHPTTLIREVEAGVEVARHT
jgi:hypothetical protein